jgi:DDE superfamily endonuclease
MDDIIVIGALAAGIFHMSEGRIRTRTGLYKNVRVPFRLEHFNEEAVLHLFRLKQVHILTIASSIGGSAMLTLENRSKAPIVEALCILLNRLSYPCGLEVMETTFRRPFSVLSRICNAMINIAFCSFGHLLSLSSSYVNVERLREWMDAAHSKGAPLEHCFGFLDGTVRPICRPWRLQRQAYNGHKRVHALKFQSLSSPDGLILDLTGPWEGRRHDCGMLRHETKHGSHCCLLRLPCSRSFFHLKSQLLLLQIKLPLLHSQLLLLQL